MNKYRLGTYLRFIGLSLCSLALSLDASAAVSFVSADNNVSLSSSEDNGEGGTVFIFSGLADGESSNISFSTDSDCPYVAITGGAKFNAPWTCADGQISMNITYKGGLSFGPSSGEISTFYVTFGTPPAPPGEDTPPAAFKGIQFSLYGDIRSWGITGGVSSSGPQFGIELTGSQGGEAHLAMYLPSAAASYLGSVLGMSVAGKPNPFANITTNDDGSVQISVDVADLQKSGFQNVSAAASTVKKKFLAGQRTLGISTDKPSIKAGKNLKFAMCAGSTFTAGNKVSVSFLVGGKSKSSLKDQKFTLNAKGCSQKTIKISSGLKGTLTAKIKYKGKSASTSALIK